MGDFKGTPGPWTAFNMVHADRGDAMTPDEIGEYVANSVRKSIEDGGSADRFLFISGGGGDAPDVCHVGNGPRGPFNARLIAASPLMLDAAQRLLAVNDEFERRQSLGVAAAIEQLAGVQQHSATELRAMGVKALADLRAALSLATGEA